MQPHRRKILIGVAITIGVVAMLLAGLAWRYYYGPLIMTHAAARGDLSTLRTLRSFGVGTDVNGFLVGGPLHCAVAGGQLQSIAVLVDMGADLNRLDGYGDTPLHIAIRHEQYQALEWLLEQGCDLTVLNRDGKTPLQYAVERDAEKFVIRLTKKTGVEQGN
jgi:ankyrin repeat protein